jgi:hypothetical protein
MALKTVAVREISRSQSSAPFWQAASIASDRPATIEASPFRALELKARRALGSQYQCPRTKFAMLAGATALIATTLATPALAQQQQPPLIATTKRLHISE